MTTDHADESLAEVLWFAIDLAIPEDVKEAEERGRDWRRSPGRRTEILTRISDLDDYAAISSKTFRAKAAHPCEGTLTCRVRFDTPRAGRF